MQKNNAAEKPKIDVYSIIVKIIMAVGFYGLAMISSESLVNMMPFTKQFATILQLGEGKAIVIIKYVVPVFVAALYYIIYSFFARSSSNTANRTFLVLGQNSDVTRIRSYLDSAVVLVSILKILCGILFMYVPYISVIAKPLFSMAIVIIAIAFAVFGITSKHEKKYLPIVFNSMIAPMILLCIVA